MILPSAFCLLPSTFCLLPSTFCLLPSAFCLLPSAFCLLALRLTGANFKKASTDNGTQHYKYCRNI